MAQGMELLDNGTKVFTGPGAAFWYGRLAAGPVCHAAPQRNSAGPVQRVWDRSAGLARCRAPWPMHSGGAGCRCFGPVPPCCAGNAGGRAYYRSFAPTCGHSAKSGPEQGKYDFAACNPPYFTGGYVSPDARRATARHDGSCTMQDVAACAARALHDGGKLALCHRPEQMAAVFAALLRRWAGAQAGSSGAQG